MFNLRWSGHYIIIDCAQLDFLLEERTDIHVFVLEHPEGAEFGVRLHLHLAKHKLMLGNLVSLIH